MLVLAYPWLIVLLPVPWLLRIFLPPQRETRVAVQVPFGDRIQTAAAGGSVTRKAARSVGPLLISSLIWLLIITALARPQWLEEPVTRELPTRDLLLLVDLSTSMRQEDFVSSTGTKVDRL
jgi:Ca-activated chloride channel family protein